MTYSHILCVAVLSSACVALPAAELRPACMFGDHAVLQRDRPVPVWGWANPGEDVTVAFGPQKKRTKADAAGKWRVLLDPLEACAEPRDLKINDLVVRDVVVGDVWLCAGQSNMAMTIDGQTKWLHVGGIMDAKEVVRNSWNPLIRHCGVGWKTDTKPQDGGTATWAVAGPDTTADFSATGYFFARELQDHLRIPIGIINASFGGSSVEGWTSREALAKEADAEFVAQMNELIEAYDHHEQLTARYVAALAAWEASHGRSDPAGAANDATWAVPTVDVSDWKHVALPASCAQLGYAEGGVVWLRREVDVPKEFGTAWRLDFPACQGSYSIFLNGKRIFAADPANNLGSRPSRPTIDRNTANVGLNTLVIKVQAYSGADGITGGPFAIVPFDPKYPAMPLAGGWRCRAEKAFPPLPKSAEPRPVAPKKGTLHWMPVPSQ